MNNRKAIARNVEDLPSLDLNRARQFIIIAAGLWLCIGVMAAAARTGLFA